MFPPVAVQESLSGSRCSVIPQPEKLEGRRMERGRREIESSLVVAARALRAGGCWTNKEVCGHPSLQWDGAVPCGLRVTVLVTLTRQLCCRVVQRCWGCAALGCGTSVLQLRSGLGDLAPGFGFPGSAGQRGSCRSRVGVRMVPDPSSVSGCGKGTLGSAWPERSVCARGAWTGGL